VETATQVEQTKTIKRTCTVCGGTINIVIYTNKNYSGGHYFGRLLIGDNKKAEYWECNDCFNK